VLDRHSETAVLRMGFVEMEHHTAELVTARAVLAQQLLLQKAVLSSRKTGLADRSTIIGFAESVNGVHAALTMVSVVMTRRIVALACVVRSMEYHFSLSTC
jgi:hypothetical protein